MSEDIWAKFDDWLIVGGPGGDWPLPFDGEELTKEQRQVVDCNVELLLDREAWHEKVDAFEGALLTIEDAINREQKRGEFCIRFYAYEFDRELYPVLSFFRYVFPCSVSFAFVNFGDGDVFFNLAKFSDGNIYFENAQFGNGNLEFGHTRFGNGDVFFRGVRFGSGNNNFYGTEIGAGNVFFTSSQVDAGYIYFSHMVLSEKTKFFSEYMNVKGGFHLNSKFLNTVFFTGLKVTEATILSNSTFKVCPDFRYADFGRPPEVAGMKVPPPEMGGEKLYKIFKTCPDGEDAPKYRKLNAMAKAANDHDKELEFFAYEMMAKRGHEITGFWELLANSFYYHVSYYGQSWIRPLIGMAISCFTFFWIYFIYAMGSLKCLENVWFSIRYSLLNTLPFVSALYRSSIQPKDYESGLMLDLDKMATVNDEMVNGSLGGLMFFSFVQQFIGIVLLFFLLLGLRNRFRLK